MAWRLLSRLWQINALIGEFRRALGEPADAAFALVHGKRWIEQLVELPDCQILEVNGIAPGGAGGRWHRAQAELYELTNGIGADRVMSFRPGIDIRGQPLRQFHGAD